MATQPYGGQYGGASGGDPRGRLQNQSDYQRKRYESQQNPMWEAMAHNYGRGSESNYGDYTDIMNQYRSIASGGGSGSGGSGGGGGGGGGGGYSAFHVSPGRAGYSDPFKSYAGFEEFSKTGGYSPQDVANMRARGTAPVRAAYANAEQQLSRGRALQGGYSPNAAAAAAKMAREQSQAGADAMQGVEAGLAQMVQQGKLQGLTGMSGIEGQRLGADVDISKFNTDIDFRGQTYNADADTRAQEQNIAAAERAGAASSAAAGDDMRMRLAALGGMTQLYGTTPGMSELFGNQLINATGQSGAFGNNLYQNDIAAMRTPGAYEQNMGRFKDIANTAATMAYPLIDKFTQRRQPAPSVGSRVGQSRPQFPTGPGIQLPRPSTSINIQRPPSYLPMGQNPYQFPGGR